MSNRRGDIRAVRDDGVLTLRRRARTTGFSKLTSESWMDAGEVVSTTILPPTMRR